MTTAYVLTTLRQSFQLHFLEMATLLPPYFKRTRMQKLKARLVGAQGYQIFPLSKPVVGPNIALTAVPAYMAYTPT